METSYTTSEMQNLFSRTVLMYKNSKQNITSHLYNYIYKLKRIHVKNILISNNIQINVSAAC